MNDSNFTRRTLLRVGAVGIAGSLTGCLDRVQDTVPGFGGPGYRDWLPDPRALGIDHYSAAHVDVAEVDDNRREFERDFFDEVRTIDQWIPGIDFQDLDDLTFLDNTFVAAGDFDADRVVDAVREQEYTYGSEYEGYEIYDRDEQSAIGISDDRLVGVSYRGELSPALTIEIVVDAGAGDEDRYHEVDDDFASVTDELGTATFVGARTNPPREETGVESGRFRNQVGLGSAWDVDGETTDVKAVVAFRNERDVDGRAVEDWIAEDSSFEYVYDTDVEEDGTLAIVEGTIDTRDVETLPF